MQENIGDVACLGLFSWLVAPASARDSWLQYRPPRRSLDAAQIITYVPAIFELRWMEDRLISAVSAGQNDEPMKPLLGPLGLFQERALEGRRLRACRLHRFTC